MTVENFVKNNLIVNALYLELWPITQISLVLTVLSYFRNVPNGCKEYPGDQNVKPGGWKTWTKNWESLSKTGEWTGLQIAPPPPLLAAKSVVETTMTLE